MKTKTLGEVAEYVNGRAFKPTEWEETGLPIIRIQNLTNSSQACNRTTQLFEEKYLVKDGDLLFAWSASLGAHIWHGENGWLNQHIFKVIPDKSVDKMYLYFYLLHIVDQLYAKTHGSGMVHITLKPFKDTPIIVPSIFEQQRIVDRIESLFAKLDEAREKVQEVVDGFETRKAAILHKAFTGELTAQWRKEHGVVIESWEIAQARNICGFITKGETPTKFVTTTGEIPFLKVYNIRDNTLDFNFNPAFIAREIHENKMKRSKVYPNDVIMNIVGPPLQKVAIVTDQYPEWNINQAIAIFRPTEKTTSKYLYYCLLCEDTLLTVLQDVRGVVGQSNISLEQCRDLRIPLPSLPEQQEIVRILDSLFEKEQQAKESAEAVLEPIDLIKKSILARAFRGELGTNNPAEESAVELLKELIS